jgi:hypothetical protein
MFETSQQHKGPLHAKRKIARPSEHSVRITDWVKVSRVWISPKQEKSEVVRRSVANPGGIQSFVVVFRELPFSRGQRVRGVVLSELVTALRAEQAGFLWLRFSVSCLQVVRGPFSGRDNRRSLSFSPDHCP